MTTVVVLDPVAGVATAVDAALGEPLSPLPDLALADRVAALEVQRRRLQALEAHLVAELDTRGAAGAFGCSTTAALVAQRCGVSVAEARRRVARALDTQPSVQLSGATVAPVLPEAGVAWAAGQLSGEHVDVMTAALPRLDRLPDAVALVAVADRFLTRAARCEDPARLRRSAALLLTRLDPDGVEPADEAAARRRDFTLTPTGAGGSRPSGELTAELTAALQTVLDALSRPLPGPDGERDERTGGQRRHDALLEVALRLLRSGTLPESGGTPVTILLRAAAADLDLDRLLHRPLLGCSGSGEPMVARAGRTGRGGVALTDHGQPISLATLRRLADEAEIAVVALNARGAVLRYARTRRLGSSAQRRALTVRDGGCCFPNCDRPAAWCQTHHVMAWLAGGTTDIDNLCLVCPYHHRLLDHGDWQVIMQDGLPAWIPPPWLDPSRTSRRNTVHHPPDIDFDVGPSG